MTAVRPLLPADTTALWQAYRAQDRGSDLHDDLATTWALPAFDRLLWRPGAVQQLAVDVHGDPIALGRLVDVDFRNRAARFELWRLADPEPLVAADLVDASLAHAFGCLGLHRVGYLLPSYLVGTDYAVVARRFEPEGTLAAYVFRRGRAWDVQAFGAVAVGSP